jgi:hypothetical protein
VVAAFCLFIVSVDGCYFNIQYPPLSNLHFAETHILIGLRQTYEIFHGNNSHSYGNFTSAGAMSLFKF